MNAKNKYNPQPESSLSTYILGGVAVVVIAVLVIGGVLWSNNRNDARNDGYGTVTNSDVEVSLGENGAVTLGVPGAPNVVDIFEDPMCPYCRELEHRSGQELAQTIDEGRVEVRFHVLNFLDQLSSSKDYSTRAIVASQCVALAGDGPAYASFHSQLFSEEFQPEENGGSDHTNEELAQLARDSGASDEAAACIASGERVEQAGQAAQTSMQALAATGSQGTPTVLVNGELVDALGNPEWVSQIN